MCATPTPFRRFRPLKLSFATGVVCLCFTICAVQHATAAAAAPSPGMPAASRTTNFLSQASGTPKSVFVIPTTAAEGKDPFFPQSTRLRPVQHATKSNPPPAVAELELKGISGAANRRLAIINNRTFEAGEEGDVMCSGTRIRIKCVQIEPGSVQIIVNGKERVLKLHTKL